MAINIGINGFGRIGRLVARAILERGDDAFRIVAVNDLTDARTLAHLFRYDSVHGTFPGPVRVDGNNLILGGQSIRVLSQRDPSDLPWDSLDCALVVESTGFFRSRSAAAQHLKAGARKVVISAPAKDKVDATIVLGVNDHTLTGQETVISNASCTTNCLAPMVKILGRCIRRKKWPHVDYSRVYVRSADAGFSSRRPAPSSCCCLLYCTHDHRCRARYWSCTPPPTGRA